MNIIIVACGNVNTEQLGCLYQNTREPYLIGVDRGTVTILSAGLPVSLSVGDYDSLVEGDEKKLEAVSNREVLNPVKDDSDTEHTLRRAIDMKPESIVLMGATGSRLDHTFSCIRMLRAAEEKGIDAYILDENNKIRVTRGEVMLYKNSTFYYRDRDYKNHYISVLPYGDELKHLTEKGFKYEIEDYTLPAASSRGVSNEIVQDKGIVSCPDYMIIMETRD